MNLNKLTGLISFLQSFKNLRTQFSTGSNPKSERFNCLEHKYLYGEYVFKRFIYKYILLFAINNLLCLFFNTEV